MNNRALVATGAAGTIAAVVCCAAPGLVSALAALSLAGAAAWFGRVVIAVIIVFATLAGYWIYHRRSRAARATGNEGIEPDDR